jgi:hypothetical protein
MAATRVKHSASATLEPPNLCTTHALGSGELIKLLLRGLMENDCGEKTAELYWSAPLIASRQYPQHG